MKMKNETKILVPNHEDARELSCRIDHTITEADFNTNRPNTHRVDYIAGDIRRYLKRGGKI